MYSITYIDIGWESVPYKLVESCEISVILIEFLYLDFQKEEELLEKHNAGRHIHGETDHEEGP